ncbi:MAG TPA: O-antigen ligase family protein [Candidatus Sulfotelmatobacter sp.]
MTKDLSKGALAATVIPLLPFVLWLAYSRPGYFTSETYMAGFIGLELLAVALWRFRQIFFALLMYVFLSAGSALPGASFSTRGRWILLGIGALVGALIMLKERQFRLGFFHLIALSCVMAGLVSAAVSRYPDLAMLKALSLFLLFLYAASGARLAVEGRERRFLNGLVIGGEILVAGTAAFYAAGIEVMGNPNSLGAVMGVVGIPVLLWGILVSGKGSKDTLARRRRVLLFFICMYLVYYSHARAGMLAAAISSALLCVGLREYKMLMKGCGMLLMIVAGAAVLQPQTVSSSVSMFTSDVVYKSHDQGVLASRQSPWNEAMDSIRTHFWFGTGFGTTDTAHDSTITTGNFASNFAVTAEYGSSYLAILVWVGAIGALPFLLLLLLVARSVIRTFLWMRATGSALHPAVPLALVVVAGLVHAGLEDWLFAVGYYLCVFFWSMAFVLVDIAPVSSRASAVSFSPLPNALRVERQILVAGR